MRRRAAAPPTPSLPASSSFTAETHPVVSKVRDGSPLRRSDEQHRRTVRAEKRLCHNSAPRGRKTRRVAFRETLDFTPDPGGGNDLPAMFADPVSTASLAHRPSASFERGVANTDENKNWEFHGRPKRSKEAPLSAASVPRSAAPPRVGLGRALDRNVEGDAHAVQVRRVPTAVHRLSSRVRDGSVQYQFGHVARVAQGSDALSEGGCSFASAFSSWDSLRSVPERVSDFCFSE